MSERKIQEEREKKEENEEKKEKKKLKKSIKELKRQTDLLSAEKEKIENKISILVNQSNKINEKLSRINLFEELEGTSGSDDSNIGYHLIDPALLFDICNDDNDDDDDDDDSISQLFKTLTTDAAPEEKEEKEVARFRNLVKELALVQCIYRTQTTNIVGGRGYYQGNWEVVENSDGCSEPLYELKIIDHGTLKKEFKDDKDGLEEETFLCNYIFNNFFKEHYKLGDIVDESEFEEDSIDWCGAGDHKGFRGRSRIVKLAFIVKVVDDEDDDDDDDDDDQENQEEK
jgi:hypothetical protein